MMADIKPNVVRLDYLKRDLKSKVDDNEYIDSFFDYNKIINAFKNENDKFHSVNMNNDTKKQKSTK